MPSIFTRARTTSAKKLPKPPQDLPDEFGRVQSRGPPTASRPAKDKRARTQSSGEYRNSGDVELVEQIEDGYLPTSMEQAEHPQQSYGYLSHGRHVVLGLEDVTKLVEVVAEELGARGLTTPFLFSNTAIDISTHGVKRLVNAFMGHSDFEDECRFAGPHELGMVLRWGLSRVVRIVNGQELRGLIAWETYLEWREGEEAGRFSPTDFTKFIPLLPVPVRSLILTLFTLLTRLVAHSTSSGLTPPTLSSLFGPLIFGLGHLSLAFHHVYAAYLRAAHATEHLMLSFIRLQDAQAPASTPIPSRLKSWIKGYPGMLAPLERFDRPRRGVRTTRVTSVRRNVRLYSTDLVRTCASWGREREGAHPGDLRSSKEWQRIAPAGASNLPPLPPRYSDAYRKKMDLPNSFNPEMGSASNLSTTSSLASTVSTLVDDKEFGRSTEGEQRFRSLTDLKWGTFEVAGFGEGDNKKLEFDLNESARNARSTKRQTLTWADFSSSGFLKDDALSTTLQFDAPLTTTITEWPNQAAEMQRKLKKSQKALPSFGWDTSPVMGGEEVIEESFMDVFCDLVYDSGWIERTEGTFRDCNWALVEFKSLPNGRPDGLLSSDPRTSTTTVLFEEFVPYEYRAQLSSQGSRPSIRKRLPSLFSPSKNKQWKPAPTLNGRPYVIGSVPRSPNAREVEFEGLLRSQAGVTKIITLDQASRSQSQLKVQSPGKDGAGGNNNRVTIASTIGSPSVTSPMSPGNRDSTVTSPGKSRRFRFPTSGTPSNRHAILVPAEYDAVDFDTRLASYSDDELNGAGAAGVGAGNKRWKRGHEKRSSRDDAWVDILVAGHGKRLEGQDAELRPPRRLRGGRSDPELASAEVAEALAAMQQHPPTDDEDTEPIAFPKIPRKTPGYFDLHPDRKPRDSDGPFMDEHVQGFAHEVEQRGVEDDEPDESDSLRYGRPEDQRESTYRESAYNESDFEPAGSSEQGDIEVPAFVDDDSHNYGPPRGLEQGTDTVVITPERTQSKTAALIEMYRDKEKKTVIASPSPSRLPVRSNMVKDQPTSLPSTPSPPRTEPDPLDTPPVLLEDIGRNSPLRYVHGAPLHNVMEERDEEEE
ncbi:hypothetical protein BD410DRAFT_901675 [Rickenella mellea]|uniref:Meiotically up-regulated protein Msb1/Mug8 domain-containing protein n=1 Tax=Rickenella mellea TaxID=50990 RepID=A0A4Y7PNM3_9AGAM|nr:hypothetical protein BD410DRAFT_901675 [Rickenella mellea]